MKIIPDWIRPWISEALLSVLRSRARVMPPIDATPLLVIVPHQDDETLGCGGLIALKRQAGARVGVVYTTDGAGSHRGHPVLTPEHLVPTRRREALAALGILGVPEGDVLFLDGPDGGLANLSDADRERMIAAIRQQLDRFQPTQVGVPYRSDMHPDHDATNAFVVEAVRGWGRPVEVLEFPLWILWLLRRGHLRLPEFLAMGKLDVSAARSLKRRAIECFITQIRPTPPWNHGYLQSNFLRRFRGRWELFLSTKYNGAQPAGTQRGAISLSPATGFCR